MNAVGDARKRKAEAQRNRAPVEAIAATLAEHQLMQRHAADPVFRQWWECGCGRPHDGAHRAHLATILAEQEAERRKVSLDAQAQWYGRAARTGAHL